MTKDIKEWRKIELDSQPIYIANTSNTMINSIIHVLRKFNFEKNMLTVKEDLSLSLDRYRLCLGDFADTKLTYT
jgi:hypothetical protein